MWNYTVGVTMDVLVGSFSSTGSVRLSTHQQDQLTSLLVTSVHHVLEDDECSSHLPSIDAHDIVVNTDPSSTPASPETLIWKQRPTSMQVCLSFLLEEECWRTRIASSLFPSQRSFPDRPSHLPTVLGILNELTTEYGPDDDFIMTIVGLRPWGVPTVTSADESASTGPTTAAPSTPPSTHPSNLPSTPPSTPPSIQPSPQPSPQPSNLPSSTIPSSPPSSSVPSLLPSMIVVPPPFDDAAAVESSSSVVPTPSSVTSTSSPVPTPTPLTANTTSPTTADVESNSTLVPTSSSATPSSPPTTIKALLTANTTSPTTATTFSPTSLPLVLRPFVILVPMQVVIGRECNRVLNEKDVESMGIAFVQVYQELQQQLPQCCRSPIQLESATVRHQQMGRRNTLLVEMEVTGRTESCENDNCTRVSLYQQPPIIQAEGEDCPCQPTEAQFVRHFQTLLLKQEQQPDECGIQGLGHCSFGEDVFETSLVLTLDSSSINNDTDSLQQAMRAALEQLYTTNEATCHSEQRRFDSVIAAMTGVNFDSTMAEPLLASPLETTDPTTMAASSQNILFTISGVCNGCQNKPLFLGSSSSGVTSDEENKEPPSNIISVAARTSTRVSDCFCPINSTQLSSAVPIGTVTEAFQDVLLRNSDITMVREAYEVKTVACTHNRVLTNMTTPLTLHVSTNEQHGWSLDERAALARVVGRAYAALNDRLCDPLDRQIHHVRVVSVGSSNSSNATAVQNGTEHSGCALWRLQLELSGTCLGCDNQTSLFVLEEEGSRRTDELPQHNSLTQNRQRRRLQGSNTCFCPVSSMVNGPPTRVMFETILQQAIRESNQTNPLCQITVPRQQQPPPCQVNWTSTFATTLIIDANIFPTSEDTLGGMVQMAYNRLIDRRFSNCDPAYTQILETTVAIGTNARRHLLRGRQTFDASDRYIYGRRRDGRHLQEMNNVTTSSYVVDVVVGCQDNCSPDAVPKAVLERELGTLLQNASLLPTAEVLVIREIDKFPCPAEITEFTRTVIVEFAPKSCPEEVMNIGDMIGALFVSTYNDLARSYCDPLYRVVHSANITKANTTVSGQSAWIIDVIASCRGCDPSSPDLLLYDIPPFVQGASEGELTFFESNSNRRHLQTTTTPTSGECFCDAQPIGRRAPFESEFIRTYQTIVDDLDLQCVSAIANCSFGSSFSSGIVVSIPRNQLDSIDNETQQATLEGAFKDTLSNLFATSEQSCDPEFRLIESVQASIGINVSASILPKDRRRFLQEQGGNSTNSTITGCNVTATNDEGTTSGSSTLCSDATDTSSVVPSASPTFSEVGGDTDAVYVLLFVSGVCNGCLNEFTLANEISGRRRWLQDETGDPPTTDAVDLTAQQLESNCFCPVNATRRVGPIDSSVVLTSYEANLLESQDVSLQLDNIVEVPVVPCENELRPFVTSVTITIAAREMLVDEEINAVASLFRSTYNDLVESFCDPLLRTINSVEVSNVGTRGHRVPLRERVKSKGGRHLQEDCRIGLDIELFLRGSCRGCNDFDPLLHDEVFRRRKLSQITATQTRQKKRQKYPRRRLQESDFCFCDDDALELRGPTFDEFAGELDGAFALAFQSSSGTSSSICGFFDPDEGLEEVVTDDEIFFGDDASDSPFESESIFADDMFPSFDEVEFGDGDTAISIDDELFEDDRFFDDRLFFEDDGNNDLFEADDDLPERFDDDLNDALSGNDKQNAARDDDVDDDIPETDIVDGLLEDNGGATNEDNGDSLGDDVVAMEDALATDDEPGDDDGTFGSS